MTRQEIEKLLTEELGELDEDDKEVLDTTEDFEESSRKIALLL